MHRLKNTFGWYVHGGEEGLGGLLGRMIWGGLLFGTTEVPEWNWTGWHNEDRDGPLWRPLVVQAAMDVKETMLKQVPMCVLLAEGLVR